jgi:D-aminopeptidase
MKKLTALLLLLIMTSSANMQNRPRARDLGVVVGILPTGTLNAITDVDGVLIGHTTIVRRDNIRTGVTAILPHGGNLFREKVPGAVFVGNGFGKLAGSTQVNELGEIETPILLTSTLSVPRVADFLLDYMLSLPGNEDVQSINPLVAETNDGFLNDIRGRHISRDDVIAAIKGAKSGAVAEGCVGAGTGTIAFGFKGGIGTSSRRFYGGRSGPNQLRWSFDNQRRAGRARVGPLLFKGRTRHTAQHSGRLSHNCDRDRRPGGRA